ncbi:hypothetical protein [Treponema pallidum]|uniref:Uncharacterized protein TP_0665 n=2 Tax=Treponema pallidum subsp. pallidum TaxID=161 RepID=Y665_TREPA|nr:hypothetical protein [Treponema pallidum]O83671.1 RecName: Full=Uncharacterized protein TP_0665 [Treponema pallidum subsp. pallidum str. Nichols]AAC65641.1 predicted coding region TP0665 [Treponema pallidum subsp. pallidum str. Nichols]ACD71083.1 hypothetical protein TPASS_0665 [Treponema pallidum subsp. pallidum SS14]ADD72767.1 conserved hypothetical protein [Treponema pallidum subsp. pallidum str. Chicago]AEZ60986.1 hypothetical protein TPADAL_0665 [Treponema pallidum subsp. pallidum DAL-
MTINTCRETGLHRALKDYFSPRGSRQEVELRGSICDVVHPDGTIVEVQTSGLGRLEAKLKKLLPYHQVMVVYPVSRRLYIRMLNEDGSERHYRKSPKEGSFFQIYREIGRLHDLLDHEHLSLHIVYIHSEVIKVDDRKGRSRYKKPRIVDRKLLEVQSSEEFRNKGSLAQPLLSKLPEIFCCDDLAQTGTGVHCRYALRFLRRNGMATPHSKRGRTKLYRKEPPGDNRSPPPWQEPHGEGLAEKLSPGPAR